MLQVVRSTSSNPDLMAILPCQPVSSTSHPARCSTEQPWRRLQVLHSHPRFPSCFDRYIWKARPHILLHQLQVRYSSSPQESSCSKQSQPSNGQVSRRAALAGGVLVLPLLPACNQPAHANILQDLAAGFIRPELAPQDAVVMMMDARGTLMEIRVHGIYTGMPWVLLPTLPSCAGPPNPMHPLHSMVLDVSMRACKPYECTDAVQEACQRHSCTHLLTTHVGPAEPGGDTNGQPEQI